MAATGKARASPPENTPGVTVGLLMRVRYPGPAASTAAEQRIRNVVAFAISDLNAGHITLAGRL